MRAPAPHQRRSLLSDNYSANHTLLPLCVVLFAVCDHALHPATWSPSAGGQLAARLVAFTLA